MRPRGKPAGYFRHLNLGIDYRLIAICHSGLISSSLIALRRAAGDHSGRTQASISGPRKPNASNVAVYLPPGLGMFNPQENLQREALPSRHRETCYRAFAGSLLIVTSRLQRSASLDCPALFTYGPAANQLSSVRSFGENQLGSSGSIRK